jgi:hypothetical protein
MARSRVFAAFLSAIMAGPALARADGTVDSCAQDAVEGQKLHRAGKLLRARERFVACAQTSCREDIVRDCTDWLARLDSELPSIVVAAKDHAGSDLRGLRVSIDDAPVEDASRAIPLDPGRHRLVITVPGRPPATRDVVLHEGERLREITFSFDEPAPAPERRAERPIPPLALLAGGVAVFGLVGFGTLGGIGVSDRSSSGCDRGCDSNSASRVRTELLVADISLVVGVVASAVATALFLTRPERAPIRSE